MNITNHSGPGQLEWQTSAPNPVLAEAAMQAPIAEQLDIEQCIRLSLLAESSGIGARGVRRLAELAGGMGAVLGLTSQNMLEMVGGPPDRIHRLSSALRGSLLTERADRLAEQCHRQRIGAMACTDPRYPVNLRHIGSRPLILYWRGQDPGTIFKDTCAATIIGTRRPTGYGRLMTRRIAEPLAAAGMLLISGLARGIDTIVHETALAAGQQTVGVLACGVDIVYPPENASLVGRMCEQGAIISEHLPGTPPKRTFFPARNRILSGLADAVIIIEASVKSGSMITASYAADQGRDVYAVPGNALSRESEGCNSLIREGAFLLTDAEDVLWRIPSARRLDAFAAAMDDSGDGQDEDPICQLLRGGSLTLNDLSGLLGEPLPEILCRLTDLEMQGLVIRDRGRFALAGTGNQHGFL